MAGANCAVCQWPTRTDVQPQGDAFVFDCLRCGRFELTGTVQHRVVNSLSRNERALVSHGLHLMHEGALRETVTLDSYTLTDVLAKKLPGVPEQADRFIRWLG